MFLQKSSDSSILSQRLFAGLGVLLCMIVGCSSPTLKSISSDDSQRIKSGMTLEEAEKILGPSHSPSNAQLKSIESNIATMPEPMKTNAAKDRAVAWGDDQGFLIVKVNEKNVIWMTQSRFGGAAPNPPPFPPPPIPSAPFPTSTDPSQGRN